MSDNLQGIQMEGLSIKGSGQTLSFLVENQELKINKRLLFRKVNVLRGEKFPVSLDLDIESFEAFSVWLHQNELPVLNATYHEKDGALTYSGYNPERLYKIATWLELYRLANNIMDCIRRVHVSYSVGFTKDEITRIYAQQIPHYGLTLFAALWIHLEDTRPNNYLKVTTKAERDALLENKFIASDVGEHRRPWFPGNQSACSFHIHLRHGSCPKNYSIDVGLWVVDKDGELKELHDWRIQRLMNPIQTPRDLSPQLSEASNDASPD
ncbi:hypothetical protein BCON_0088g00300 [Botryotinia convoluta]|uniref:Uncharacterized protein n=1 Tax=Botryotinia convoluta TaxID=54673 RepID=A0A4Z1I227_9HELO|nr:hypothetical protein BCON_0088g00300 [Botryotinia convoluta]